MRRKLTSTALPLFLLAFPITADAWDAAGHEVIAAIAEQHLTPAARRLVTELVGATPLSDSSIAAWADTQRDSTTRRWHYVNIPFTADRYVAARDCPRNACAVAAIERTTNQLLGHGSGSAADRATALRWLVHLVGDLHQPLHAGDGWDYGGNACHLRLGRRQQPTNLHHVWDTDVVAPLLRPGEPRAVAARLSAEIPPSSAQAWTSTLSPATWAIESNREARTIYAELGRRPQDTNTLALPVTYSRQQHQRVTLLLERAGVRLAAVLNSIAVHRQQSEQQGHSTSSL